MEPNTNPLNELATALAKAQGEIEPAPKDANNPYYHSKYASLPAVRAAMRDAFARHGLSVVQIPEVDGDSGRMVTIEDSKGNTSEARLGSLRLRTILFHSSGQSLDCGCLSAEVDLANPQKIGSAITYFRRYALAAISQTVADDDDDANAAAQPPTKTKAAKKLSGHEVVELQRAIHATTSAAELAELLKGTQYQMLKSTGPADIYEQTQKLAKAKHAVLPVPPAEQAGEDEPKPF